MGPDLDRVLAPGYLSGLESRSDDELRAMLKESRDVEAQVSLFRRAVQSWLEILEAELARRATGGGRSIRALVESLPRILGGGPSGPSRRPALSDPSPDRAWRRQLEEALPAWALAHLDLLSDQELARCVERLRPLERGVSDARRRLHAVIGELEAEQKERLSRRPTSAA